MHYYIASDRDAEMRARIRELEEELAGAELTIAELFDEIDECRGRERRMLWTALALGTVMVIAIAQASWLAIGR